MYRGERQWNKSKKRNAWGQRQQTDRPASDWLVVKDESLRIVSDAAWQAAHSCMEARCVANVIERALDVAVQALMSGQADGGHARRLEKRLAQINTELKNLTEMAARGGDVPVILDALAQRDAERGQCEAELSAHQTSAPVDYRPKALRSQLRGLLNDWHQWLADDVAKARPLLSVVLADRITFDP